MRPASLALWIGALALGLGGFVIAGRADRDRMPELHVSDGVVSDGSVSKSTRSAPQGTLIESAWRHAPFREGREPPRARYDPEAIAMQRAADSVAAAAARHRPPWTLRAVVIGPPSVAVFEGMDGSTGSGSVVAVGDQIDGFVVRHISADGVDIARGDHSWRFTISSPWTSDGAP